MLDAKLDFILERVAAFYDLRKVGDVGHLGFRRSAPLSVLKGCLGHLIREKVILPGETRFLDMGCADGRVNVLISYLVKSSVGIEIDDWTLDEYGPLKEKLVENLAAQALEPPPDNIHLVHGDTLDEAVYRKIKNGTGLDFSAFDLFYTYITMHREFGERIAEQGRKGACFLIYGLDLVLPRFQGLRLLEEKSLVKNKLILYRKE